MPSSSAISIARAIRSVEECPHLSIAAPYPSIAANLAGETSSGTTTTLSLIHI